MTAKPTRKKRRVRAASDGPGDLAAAAIAEDRGGDLLDADGQLPRDLRIEWRPVTEVRRYPNNPRANTDAVADVRASLLEFGWEQPIVTGPDGEIIVGDTRYLAALDLRQTHVPVYVARHLTPAKAKAYRLADNKTGERAGWDFPRLRMEFGELRGMGVPLTITGFRDAEIAPIMDDLPAANFKEFDESSADGVKMAECPKCGERFPA